tara:strand:+ start:593 stop:1771 length:1179 start_codon:yes stop_codon:yes gene_type:complete
MSNSNIDDSQLIDLTQALIRQPSITPKPELCLDIISDFCQDLGWYCRRIDKRDTANLFITTKDCKQHSLLFGGHVDVVPPGDFSLWRFPPFSGHITDGKLYGRGAVDMKSSIAAFLMALKWHHRRLSQPESPSIALVITSDEEGDAIDGTDFVMSTLADEGYCFDCALVGEPTSDNHVGDIIKIGRRGSLSAELTINGTQSHVAYANQRVNPIYSLATFIQQAQTMHWDDGHSDFSATAFCPTKIHADTGASNVTPSHAVCQFNFRFCPASTPESLKKSVTALLDQQHLPYQLTWSRPNLPFFKPPGKLCRLVKDMISRHFQPSCNYSTSGGTSDARFIVGYVQEIMELGPLNATAHKVDEHISLSDLSLLYSIYQSLLGIVVTSPDNVDSN